MIRRLQKRFIRIAVLVLTAAMVMAVGIVNTANLVSVRGELQNTLRMLAESAVPMNSGNLPEPDESGTFRGPGARFGEKDRHSRNMMNESNWFMVHFTPEGEIRNKNLTRMTEDDEAVAETLALQALESGRESGWIQDYCFLIREEGSRADQTA